MTSWTYQVEISGLLDDQALALLGVELGGGFVMTEPASTVLTGTAADQAALFGVLERLHSLGLQVREFRRVQDVDQRPAALSPEDASRAAPERRRG